MIFKKKQNWLLVVSKIDIFHLKHVDEIVDV